MMQFTLQEVFDKTVTFLANQGGQSRIGSTGICAYRAGNRKCAYGAWIPDALYTAGFEGCALTPEGVPAHYGEKTEKALLDATGLRKGSEHFKLMKALQYAHDDTAGDVRVFRIALTKVAAEFHLDGYVIGLVSTWSK